jgi:hypothetical protein
MRVAPLVKLTEDQDRTLQQWARGRSLPARQVERARVVLLAAAGKQDLEIAAEIGISNQKAARWRKRFLKMDRVTADGFPVHSFDTLLRELATRCRNTCRNPAESSAASFQQHTQPTPLQSRAFQLLGL